MGRYAGHNKQNWIWGEKTQPDPCSPARHHQWPSFGQGFIPKSIGWRLILPKVPLHKRDPKKPSLLLHCVQSCCHILAKMVFSSTHCSWTLIPETGPGPVEFPRCQRGAGIMKCKDCSLKCCLQDSFLKASCQLLACGPVHVER